MVFHQGDLYHGGLSLRDLSSRWSHITVVSHHGGFSSRWSLITVVSHRALSLRCSHRSLFRRMHGVCWAALKATQTHYRRSQHAEHKVSLNFFKAELSLKRYWLGRRCQDLGEREAIPFVMLAVITRMISALRSAAV